MMKFIVKIVLFFTIVCCIDYGIGLFGDWLRSNSKGGGTKQFNDLVCNDVHDVLILGSSRAHRHYDSPNLSDSLNLDVYNAGYDGNGVILANGILNLVLNRYSPKLVIYDVEPAFDINIYAQDNNNLRYLSLLKPYFQDKCVSDIIKDISVKEWYKVKSGMYRHNTTIISLILDNFINRDIEHCGYSPLCGKMTYKEDICVNEQGEVDDVKLNYIRKLIELCKDWDVPLVFVASPKYGVADSTVLKSVVEICDKYDIPFWNYYTDELFTTNPELFNDSMHLNVDGARVFSCEIVQDIKDVLSI